MSYFAYVVARPLSAKVTLTKFSRLVRALVLLERGVAYAAAALVLLIGVQFVYPSSRVKPFTSVGSLQVGGQSVDELKAALAGLNAKPLELKVAGHYYSLNRTDSGVSVDVSRAIEQIKDYSWQDRLLPFSLFKQRSVGTLPLKIDNDKLQSLANKLAAENRHAPRNAAAVRQADGTYQLKKQRSGLEVDPTNIKNSLMTLAALPGSTASITGRPIEPTISDQAVQAALGKLAGAQKAPPTIIYQDKKYVVAASDVRAWARFTTDKAKHKVTLSYDKQAIHSWVINHLPLVVEAPETSVVTMVDGSVTKRTSASAGKGLDVVAMVADLQTALKTGQASVTAPLEPLSPREQYIRRYTPTNRGLQALMGDWLHDHPGVSTSVSFIEIGGKGRRASLNGDMGLAPASVYKLFIAWYVMHGIENGSINPHTQIAEGKNVNQCIEAAIVVSDNPCGEGLGNKYGWSNVENFIRQHGIQGVVLNQVPLRFTANGTADFLNRLQAGKLLNKKDTKTLLGYMGRQIYRAGIPAGSPGAGVQDKVGFNPGVWNDAAIVRGPRTSYVLVVLTHDGGPSAIKDLANRIQTLLAT